MPNLKHEAVRRQKLRSTLLLLHPSIPHLLILSTFSSSSTLHLSVLVRNLKIPFCSHLKSPPLLTHPRLNRRGFCGVLPSGSTVSDLIIGRITNSLTHSNASTQQGSCWELDHLNRSHRSRSPSAVGVVAGVWLVRFFFFRRLSGATLQHCTQNSTLSFLIATLLTAAAACLSVNIISAFRIELELPHFFPSLTPANCCLSMAP